MSHFPSPSRMKSTRLRPPTPHPRPSFRPPPPDSPPPRGGERWSMGGNVRFDGNVEYVGEGRHGGFNSRGSSSRRMSGGEHPHISLSTPHTPQDGIVTGSITAPDHGLNSITLHLYCEIVLSHPYQRVLFASDNESPFSIPVRPHHSHFTFSFSLPSNLPHSHVFHLQPHLPSPPVKLSISYRLVATLEYRSHSTFAECVLHLTPSPNVTYTSYLPLYSPPQHPPKATWASSTSDHAVAVALPRAYTVMGVAFPICVSVRVPGVASVWVEATWTEHVAWDGGCLFKVRRVGKWGGGVQIFNGVGHVTLEMCAGGVYPSARVGEVGVAHGIEVRVGGMTVSVPVVVLPGGEGDGFM